MRRRGKMKEKGYNLKGLESVPEIGEVPESIFFKGPKDVNKKFKESIQKEQDKIWDGMDATLTVIPEK